MREEIFIAHQDVPRPRAEVFAFFSNPANLEKLTPPWLNFRILTPEPLPRGEGALFEYQLRVRGLPMRWRTLIESWQEGERFTDRQVLGPYALWHHTHRFEDLPDGGTRIHDCVRYRAPFGLLGRIVTAIYLRRDIEGIFQFRQKVIAKLFS
ncbi:MAG: SRPBCC family protein [Holophaga sp.]|nr:SRPBCC family protein [Holophaga sp.]